MSEDNEYIKFDIGKILDLKDIYCEVMEFVQQDLYQINLNSIRQIKQHYLQQFAFDLPNIQIQTFQKLMDMHPDTHPIHEISEQLVVYLKAKYMLKNYITCILKHEVDGVVNLRDFDGRLSLPNRQPLPYSHEILDTVVNGSKQALSLLPKGE